MRRPYDRGFTHAGYVKMGQEVYPCTLTDMSLSGAAIAAENRPPLKSLVMLGQVQSRVVRNLEEGFAIEFVHQQTADALEERVTAR